MNTLFSIILWILGLLNFFLVAIVLILITLIFPARKAFLVAKHFARWILKAIGVRVRVFGKRVKDIDKSVVFMGNHESMFDAFIYAGYLPGYFVGVEAAEHFSWPVWGTITKRFGTIPIQRGNLTEAIKSIETAKSVLNSGTSIAILPEGHRTLDGKMRSFKKGPFHLVKDTKADILPVAIRGAFEIKKKYNWRISPGWIIMVIGEPIP
jgi:1-acyl-sn-glycerol-3-phosphate acyltransferase